MLEKVVLKQDCVEAGLCWNSFWADRRVIFKVFKAEGPSGRDRVNNG